MSNITTPNLGIKVSIISIVVNFLLFAGKLVAGLLGNSGAMVSDAIHSASDLFTTVIVIIGVSVSGKEEDQSHQYGHEKLECIAAIIISAILFFTGGIIGLNALENIFAGAYENLAVPTLLPLIAAIISIIMKEWMFQYTKRAAKITNSEALMADAWHHRSDALSSIGSFIGIGGALLGFPIFDSIAMLAISIMIIKAAYDIVKIAIDKLVDKAIDSETQESIRQTALCIEGVLDVDSLKTRLFGNKFYVDVEICCNPNLTLREAHDIAENVHEAIEVNFPMAKHCMVHVNPMETLI